VDERLRERLSKLEALFARAGTAGEQAAAGAAIQRLQARVGARPDPEVELKFSLPDAWSVRLFVAVCRKHGLRPYRYPRQRRTTVMVRVRPKAFEQTIAVEFQMLHRELTGYFGEMVNHLIANVMRSDGDDETLEQRQIAP
jgi:hypothetical protein